jgi:hypothetical protein
MPSAVCRALIAALCAILALFFAFVGWNKAFASLADLARHGSWTIYLPDWLGRIVGWSEMLLAIGLIAGLPKGRGGVAFASALLLVANQLVAAFVHLAHGESSALPQNAVLIALLLVVAQAKRPAKGETA